MARACADRENWSNLTSLDTLMVQFFISVYIFRMHWCAWQHTALSLLIETEFQWVAPFSVSTSRSPMTTVVLLGFLRCAHCPGLLVLGAFWTTSWHDCVPSDAPFWQIPVTRLSKTVMKTTEFKMLRTSPWLCTSPPGHWRYRSHAWNTWSRHALRWCSLQLPPSAVIGQTLKWGTKKKWVTGYLKKDLKIVRISHGVLKNGLKNCLNPPILYRLGGLNNSHQHQIRWIYFEKINSVFY